MKKATALRQAESSEFQVKKKDYETGQQACAAAIKVLRQYYEGKSFLQVQSKTQGLSLTQQMEKAEQPMAALSAGEGGGGAPSAASGIIGLLEVAESDFSRLLAECQAAEDEAQSEFEKLSEDSKVSRAAKDQDLKNKRAERQRLGSVIAEVKEDLDDAKKELAAVTEYHEKLKSSCETKTPSFEERQARRKEEIEGLQNALGILEGKDIALLQALPRSVKFLGA